MHSQVLLNTMHVQVCTLDRCCEYQRTHLLHACYRMCICAMYTHVYMHMYTYIYMCMHVYIYICMYFYTYIRIYIWMCICVCVYVYVYIYIYVCICMCIYIYVSQGIVSRFVLFVPCIKSKILHCKKARAKNDMSLLQWCLNNRKLDGLYHKISARTQHSCHHPIPIPLMVAP